MLIPGLPEDVALLCLLCVPRRFHGQMRAVCKVWKSALESAYFSRARAETGLAEPWIYALVSRNHVSYPDSYSASIALRAFDPQARKWMPAAPLPSPLSRAAQLQAQVVKGKLVVCGGRADGVPLDSVAVYDPGSGKWGNAAPMRHARADFMAAVVNDRLYVLGGERDCGSGGVSEHLAMECYDVGDDLWSDAPALAEGREAWGSIRPRPAVALGHHLFVPCHSVPDPGTSGPVRTHRFCAERWEWDTVSSNLFEQWKHFDPFVVRDQQLLWPVPDGQNLAGLSVYETDTDSWRPLYDCALNKSLRSLVDLGNYLGLVLGNFTVGIAHCNASETRWRTSLLAADNSAPWSVDDVILSCHALCA